LQEAISAADVEAIGTHLSAYWNQKKQMAPEAEPPGVSRLIQVYFSMYIYIYVYVYMYR
jgi:hypothetical protein